MDLFGEGRKPSFPPDFLQRLADENPLGVECSVQDVRDWIGLIWLRYSERGYKRHRKAIVAWWSRLTHEELERARARGSELRARQESERLRALREAYEARIGADSERDTDAPLPALRVVRMQ